MPKFCIIIDKKFIQIIQYYIKKITILFSNEIAFNRTNTFSYHQQKWIKTDLSSEMIKSYIITLYHWLQNNNFL